MLVLLYLVLGCSEPNLGPLRFTSSKWVNLMHFCPNCTPLFYSSSLILFFLFSIYIFATSPFVEQRRQVYMGSEERRGESGKEGKGIGLGVRS